MKTNFKKFLESVEQITPQFAPIVSMLMAIRDKAHMLHLETGSYAEHKALNELYDTLLAFTDELAEMYQGKYGKMSLSPLQNPVVGDDGKTFVAALVTWLESIRPIIEHDPAIVNKFDELIGEVYKIKYKITQLS